MFAAFPLAFAIIMPAFYLPILALLRLIFRGVAFEFRPTARTKRKRWERAFTPVPRSATTLTFSASARVVYSEVEDTGGLF